MSVLLIHTDISRMNNDIEGVYPGIGINMLATLLNKKGYKTSVIDPFKLNIINNRITSNSEEIIKEEIIKKEIRIVGISTVLQTRFKAIEIAKIVKSIDPNIKVIMGGAGATLLYKQFFKYFNECIDIIVIGEGEITFLELIDALNNNKSISGIQGIAYNDIGSANDLIITKRRKEIENLDQLPFPSYSHYLEDSNDIQLETFGILTSRGCFYNCPYCGINSIWNSLRFRSAENVLDEIRYLKEIYNVKNIKIHDDTFGFDKIKTKNLLQGIIDLDLGIHLYAHSRLDIMDKQLLTLFKKAGGNSIYYGLESGSPKIRKLMKKNFRNDKVLDVCKTTKELGIKLGLFLLFGYPGETPSDIKQTFNLVRDIDPDDVYCAITKIQIGNDLYRIALKNKKISDDMWMKKTNEYFTFLSEEEEKIVKGYQILFYENFSKEKIRTIYERNNDLMDLKNDLDQRILLEKRSLELL